MVKRLMLALGFVLVLAPAAHAQAITSYTYKIFNQGATAPFTTASLPATAVVCNTTPKLTATGTTVNPTKVAWDDPANPTTADCVYTDPGTGPLLSLPFGAQAYTSTVAAVNAVGPSADSASSNPFSRPGVVVNAPTGLRVIH